MFSHCPECEAKLLKPNSCGLCGWTQGGKKKEKTASGWDGRTCAAGLSCKLPVTNVLGGSSYCTYHFKNRNNPYLFKLFPTAAEVYGESPAKKLQKEINEDDLNQRIGETREDWLNRLAAHRRESMRRYNESQEKFRKAMEGTKHEEPETDDIPF